jgi:uncharacterized repeat protein (TIGR01451 family)
MFVRNVQGRMADAPVSRCRWIRGLPAVVAAALVVAPSAPATAHAAGNRTAKPKRSFALRIGIDDGHTTARVGDRLTYIVKVTNTGTAASPGLLLTQTLVPGLKVISSTPKAAISEGRIMWDRALPAGRTDQLRVTVEVGRLSTELRRLAAVACASAKTDKRPIVCASHMDLLPAATAASPKRRTVGPILRLGLWIAGAGALVAVLLMLALLRRRRRTSYDL